MTTTNGARADQALAVRKEVALAPAFEPRDLNEAWNLAQNLAQSSLLPPDLRGKPADVLVQVITGRELGLSPMQAIRGIHIIKGKPVLSADLMVALVKRSPVCHFFRLVESTPERAVYETQRDGDTAPTRLAWTIEQAKGAGVTGNDNWRKHPDAMLRARCSSALARAVYSDLVLGVYETSEGEEIAREPVAQRGAYVPPRDEPWKIREVPVTVTEPGVRVVSETKGMRIQVADDAPPEEPQWTDEMIASAIQRWTNEMREATNQADLDKAARAMRAAGHSKGSEVGNACSPVYAACRANLAAPAEPGSRG